MDTNGVLNSLNWMAGCCSSSKTNEKTARPSPMQREVIERVEGLVRRKQPNARPLQPQAALRKLLKGRTYDGTLSAEHMASYHEELVSFPDEDFSRLPQLGDVLGAEDSLYLEEGSELMLREVPGDCEVEVPYWDPKLKYNQKAYQKLVCRLHRQNYFLYTLYPNNFVGIFFVLKSDGERLRLISDARIPNQTDFLEPPPVELLTGEGLGCIELDFVDCDFVPQGVMDAIHFILGVSDVKDCFHRYRVPLWLAKHFAWLPVKAKVIGLAGRWLDGKLLDAEGAVYPLVGSLWQGFSWAFFLAQRAN